MRLRVMNANGVAYKMYEHIYMGSTGGTECILFVLYPYEIFFNSTDLHFLFISTQRLNISHK